MEVRVETTKPMVLAPATTLATLPTALTLPDPTTPRVAPPLQGPSALRPEIDLAFAKTSLIELITDRIFLAIAQIRLILQRTQVLANVGM